MDSDGFSGCNWGENSQSKLPGVPDLEDGGFSDLGVGSEDPQSERPAVPDCEDPPDGCKCLAKILMFYPEILFDRPRFEFNEIIKRNAEITKRLLKANKLILKAKKLSGVRLRTGLEYEIERLEHEIERVFDPSKFERDAQRRKLYSSIRRDQFSLRQLRSLKKDLKLNDAYFEFVGHKRRINPHKFKRDPTHAQHRNLHSGFAREAFSKLEQHERRKKDLKLKNKYVPEQFVGLEPLLNPLKFKNTQQRMCEHRESGICNDGDKCQFLHSSIMGKGISKTLLEEQNKAVTGIVSPAGSNKLYSGSKDGVFRIWEWHNGQCVKEFNFGSEIGCLTSKGPWIFAGLRDSVKVWSIQTATKFPDPPNGVNGQVYALETMGEDMLFDMLFAGMQDGSILAWKYISERNTFQLITTLRGHTSGVVSLKAGEQFLYSGSVDNTIRRWDLRTLQCTQTLTSHSAAITSLLFWGNHLLSCSLDKTIKAWFCTETDCSEVYTHNEKHGVLALFEMKDADNKSILVCSCTDNSVHLYELPSFTERRKLDANAAVLTMISGPGGQFFTGDIKGQIAMWKI